jgi:cytochrome c biogenesis factor
MIELGNLALSLALAASLYAIAASVYGALTRRRDFIASGEHAAYTTWALVLMASGIMVHALITHDFRIQYVASWKARCCSGHSS